MWRRLWFALLVPDALGHLSLQSPLETGTNQPLNEAAVAVLPDLARLDLHAEINRCLRVDSLISAPRPGFCTALPATSYW